MSDNNDNAYGSWFIITAAVVILLIIGIIAMLFLA